MLNKDMWHSLEIEDHWTKEDDGQCLRASWLGRSAAGSRKRIERGGERQTDRQTETETDKETKTERNRGTERVREKKIETEIQRDTERETETGRYIDDREKETGTALNTLIILYMYFKVYT